MEQNNKWGSDVCNLLANPTALKIIKNMMENNKMQTLQNSYSETDFISSEEFVLTSNGDIFSKKLAHEGTANLIAFYEELLANGEYLRFSFKPYVGQGGTYENVVLKHCDESGKEIFCKEYFDHEISAMLTEAPNHILLDNINKVFNVFEPLPTLEMRKTPDHCHDTQQQPM